MKTLSTDTAAFALGVDRKVIDNVLSREARSLVGRGRRGKSRRISVDALEQIAVALILHRDLGVGIARGLQLALELLAAPHGHVAIGTLGSLSFDLKHLRDTIERATDDALEGIAQRTRGRPTASSA